MTAGATSPKGRRGLARAMRGGCVMALCLAAAGPAGAQLASLRGEVPEDVLQTNSLDANSTGATEDSAAKMPSLLDPPGSAKRTPAARGAGGEGIQSTPYQPGSAGALPDAPDPNAQSNGPAGTAEVADPNASPFDADEPAGDLDPAVKPVTRALSTAKKRSEAQRAARTSTPETSAARASTSRAGAAKPQAMSVGGQDRDAPDTADTTGTVRQGRLDTEDEERNVRDKPGSAAAAAIEGHDAKPEDDPFRAVGIRVGGFILRSTLEQGLTYTTNANSTPEGGKALLSESTLRLNAVSDWSDSVASINAYGAYRKTLSGEAVAQPEGGVDARLEHEFGDDTKGVATLTYVAKQEDASSPVELTGTLSRPLSQVLDASLGVEKDAGKLRYGLTGKIERLAYGDADVSGGGTVSQKERDSTLGAIVLRAGYEISPALTPFVEGEVGRRIYDVKVDSAGEERSANRLAARIGVAVDLRDKLKGEITAGWVQEKFDDSSLGSIEAPTLSADLTWSPARETTVNLNGATTVEGTTTAGESGSVLYAGTATVTRNIRSNLTGTAALGLSWRDYVGTDGHDLTLAAEGGLTLWLNRYLGLTGRIRHENVKSNLPGRTTDTDSAFLGVTLQR